MIQPLGAIMPVSEMQSRVFYEQLIGRIRLPSMEQMLDDCRNREEKMAKRYVTSNRHTIQVDYLPYMDELASMFGAKPNLWRYLITDYRLGRELLFGPNVAYVYRLNGPHPWPGAREAILTVLDRVCAATKPKMPFSDEKNNQMKKSSATSMASTFDLVILDLSTTYIIIQNR